MQKQEDGLRNALEFQRLKEHFEPNRPQPPLVTPASEDIDTASRKLQWSLVTLELKAGIRFAETRLRDIDLPE
jgi:hypothetical protein